MTVNLPELATFAFPKSKRVNSGGVRKTAIACFLLTRFFEWGTDKAIPLDPPDGIEYLDARVNRESDQVELLVRSPSFVGGEDATWETAEWWIPSYRRLTP